MDQNQTIPQMTSASPMSPSAPPTPTPVGAGTVPMANPGLSQEQMKANLADLFSRVQGKYQQFNSQKFVSGNKVDSQKRDVLKAVFKMMSDAGIDPSNVRQVNQFLASLKQKSPELYQLFEMSIDSLLGQQSQSGSGTSPSSNMNIQNNENIPPNGGDNVLGQ